ncbi:MAG: hypothetical protein COU31_01045 [Candidatus Magasanikbacteria bacterium CG10_big_fil_rev_8_21_14_0_10_40_10]|uniref:UDP-N-acetylmuramate:L-alanyl-gamma-D-glutamyl-meso-diaminopimelate ligase n=1 Tax=Candidatus Magasanikbacteria bacterium CG10_big_fil_rev_8_21_14_0_10_40_10 TaxID=1974648 RepID=A0A2M6W4S6_9BACT|nr:MAG: hypothetical protein COU31_01045 [Candidatus Magasanikbacteria bacterium CG10_big_fil_rev_8_21_14_0_10_40_10]
MEQKKHIHFIGICGVAMSALAIAFDEQGWQVSGSDAGFYPPVSDNLKRRGIDFYPGWHVDKMIAGGVPDLVVVGNVAGSANPEWLYAQAQKIAYLNYPQTIAKYFVASNSIVCAGTYGKTSTSALMAWILNEAGLNPSYMFGGLATDDNFASARIGENKTWSVLEGDEYKSGRDDQGPKFSHYSPTHLLLTAVQWDHADIYPTEQKYLDVFSNLAGSIPLAGLAVVSENAPDEVILKFKCNLIKYGQNSGQFRYHDVTQNKNGLEFYIKADDGDYKITTPMLGEYMAENITGCFALAVSIGVPAQTIIDAIAKFQGIKRRLQKRGQVNGVANGADIYDDIAHSPAKANNTLRVLRKIYSDGKIYAVFEPNTGNRQKQTANGYDNMFQNADEVLIPHLTKIKTDPKATNQPLQGNELAELIGRTHPIVKYFEDDQKLLDYLKQKTHSADAVVFMGSHGWRNMIEKLTQ